MPDITVIRGNGNKKRIEIDGVAVYTGGKHDSENDLEIAIKMHGQGGEVTEVNESANAQPKDQIQKASRIIINSI